METNMNNTTPKKEDKDTLSHKVGDKIERLGEKVEEKGYKKAGDAIGKFGDKVEHLQDEKNEEYPSKKAV